jgi:threonine dehydratase
MLPTREDIEAAGNIVYEVMAPTAQYCWPLLAERLGAEIWLKHENHTPVGAFKIRGGLVFFADLANSGPAPKGVISATRGNHGQSVGMAAKRYGIPAKIVVPKGNSLEKNAAMEALGVELIEHGLEFQEAREYAGELADELSLMMVPSFHPLLVAGVATYSLELFTAVPDIDVAYVPIGLGSGICGMMAARDALGLQTKIIGVVSAHALTYAKSFAARKPVYSPVSTVLADGMACSTPDPAALELILKGVERIVAVTDEEVAAAMRTIFECTHNVSEGAGAAGFAAVMKEKDKLAGLKVATVLSGGNVDRDLFASVLTEKPF